MTTGSADDAPVVDESLPADGDVGVESDPTSEQEPTVPPIEPEPTDETVITDSDAVDPRVTAPTEVVLNPDDPTELWVRFIGGDPNCTAAEAIVLAEIPDAVGIELLVGITQDALARSCVAGEFNLRVDVALNESAEGKRITSTQPQSDEPRLVTPELSTDDFVGLPQAEAEAIANENLIPWRIGAVDGEFFALTEDFNPGRLTFEINDGVVTSAGLG